MAQMPRFRPLYAALTVVYCTGIFALSAQPSLPDVAPPWFSFPGADKVAHAGIFGGLALVVYVGLIRSNADINPRARFLIPIAFSALYGLTDEIHQLFVPNRSFDLLDLLADAVGATIVVAVLESLRHWRGARELQGASGDPS